MGLPRQGMRCFVYEMVASDSGTRVGRLVEQLRAVAFSFIKGGISREKIAILLVLLSSWIAAVDRTAAAACSSNTDCAKGEFCLRAVGDCSGTGACTLKGGVCLAIIDPVCG